ncbi:MAG: MBL fold metallo-hydrolase [Lysobacteraceae bacterium]
MRKLILAPLAMLLFGIGSDAAGHDPAARATYLGNEGVLVARGDTKVLFDAFYAVSYGQYVLVPDDIAAAMMAGDPPYDDIDAIFVSHVHGDHFTAKPAINYLRKHSTVQLYGSAQTCDAIATEVEADDPVMQRVVVADILPHDEARQFHVGDLDIEVVAIPHAGGPSRADVQNLSWRVTLDDDTTVIHFGDASTYKPDFDRHSEHFKAKRADAAFPPYWFFGNEDGEAIMRSHFNADRIIGIHVPAAAVGNGEAWRQRAGGDLFTDPGESRELSVELPEPVNENAPEPAKQDSSTEAVDQP